MNEPTIPATPPAIVAPAPVNHMEIAKQVKKLWAGVEANGRKAVSALREIGADLRRVQAEPPPGKTFQEWLAASSFKFRPRMAMYYIALSRDWVEECEEATSLAEALRFIKAARGAEPKPVEEVKLSDEDKATFREVVGKFGIEADAVERVLLEGLGVSPRFLHNRLASIKKQAAEATLSVDVAALSAENERLRQQLEEVTKATEAAAKKKPGWK